MMLMSNLRLSHAIHLVSVYTVCDSYYYKDENDETDNVLCFFRGHRVMSEVI